MSALTSMSIVLVLAGEGQVGTELGTVNLHAGALAGLPRRSRRQISAGPQGPTYLTVHKRRQALALGMAPRTDQAMPRCLRPRGCAWPGWAVDDGWPLRRAAGVPGLAPTAARYRPCFRDAGPAVAALACRPGPFP